jgi:hypothetical protein
MHNLLLYLSGNPSAVTVERTLLMILEILDPEKIILITRKSQTMISMILPVMIKN